MKIKTIKIPVWSREEEHQIPEIKGYSLLASEMIENGNYVFLIFQKEL
jgi:hypothetical protein